MGIQRAESADAHGVPAIIFRRAAGDVFGYVCGRAQRDSVYQRALIREAAAEDEKHPETVAIEGVSQHFFPSLLTYVIIHCSERWLSTKAAASLFAMLHEGRFQLSINVELGLISFVHGKFGEIPSAPRSGPATPQAFGCHTAVPLDTYLSLLST